MVSYAYISKMGGRSYNEDSIRVLKSGSKYLFALADGLGGHGNGDIASDIAVNSIFISDDMDIKSDLREYFETAQKAVLDKKMSNIQYGNMMTTLVLMQLEKNRISWGHVGDSRLYYFNDCKLQTRTLDHSVPQSMVLANMLEETQIRHHPDRNRLLRSIGSEWEKPLYEISDAIKRKGKQEFLICSDGFWENIDETEMEWFLRQALNPKQWLSKMEEVIENKIKHDDMDNYSAIAVWSDV